MKRNKHVDFSKHVAEKIVEGKTEIIKFARPNTLLEAINFINTNGVLVVTGDFGNWIFCREFRPSVDGFVSDSYWCEKLRISSTQNPHEFDEAGTRKKIEDMLKEEVSEDEKDYLTDLLNYVDETEFYYLAYAHNNLPSNRDHEWVPHVKKLNTWIEIIFDAFDEICERLKEESKR